MSENQAPAPKLGTFIGVFTPTVLTILGVIMYLRLGWVVSNAGLLGALLIVLIANAITLITALSMSALATNMRVGVGGAYFLISRSFGLEMGGAVGIPLYLSQVLSVTLYAYGLAESLRIVWEGVPVAPVAAVIVVAVAAVAARSIEWTLRLQLPIMVLIAASIGSLLLGVDYNGSQVDLINTEGAGFWEVFAVFFPAVTGVLAGVSLSGDLEDPGVAIPRGALGAVAVGAVVYMTLPFVLANGAGGAALEDPLVWTSLAAVPLLVMPGLWGAILSSAFGSILGAPRTLQALATDNLVPSSLGAIDDKTGEPTFGLYVSAGIAFVAVLLGDLNAVASWVTVFFLTTYGALNFVTCLETLTGDPSFRPRISIPWWLSLLGGLGCFVAMFAINPLACFVAIIIEAALFYMLSRRSMEATWGDMRGGMWMTTARYALFNLREARQEPRSWRPHLLVFAEDGEIDTVRMADFFGQHRGIVTVANLIPGDIEENLTEVEGRLRSLDAMLETHGILAFAEVTCVPNVDDGVMTVAQSNGFAGLHSNTVMFGYADADGVDRLAQLLSFSRKLGRLNKCTLIYRAGRARAPAPTPHVVIWWAGRENNGDLMLLLAHLLCSTKEWRGTRIILQSVVESDTEAESWRQELTSMLPDLRIDIDARVFVRPPDRTVIDIIHEESQGAELVFLGLSVAEPGKEREQADRMSKMLEKLPSAILVRNEGPFRGRLL